MDPNILAPWRDLALILLIIYAVIIVAVPGVAIYFGLKGVRWVKRKIRTPLQRAQLWAQRIRNGTTKTTDAIVRVPIRIASTSTRVTVTTRGIFDYLIGR